MAASPSPTRFRKMRRILPLALILAAAAAAGEIHFALGTAHAWLAQKKAAATTSQVLSANAITAFDSTNPRYLPLGWSAQVSATDVPYTMFPVAGAVTKLRFTVVTTPTSTQTWKAELKKNGSTTGLTCTITSASSGKCATTGSVSFAAGDYANIVVTPTNNPTLTIGSVSAVFVPTAANDTLMTGRGASFSTSSTQVGL